MIKLCLIRHSLTAGNRKRRYIGVTDEKLCEEGNALLSGVIYPPADEIFVSPLKRCIQTAGLIYPNRSVHIIDEIAECNFGAFENKSAEELAGDPRYQAWVDSQGMLPFPDGESRQAFRWRCLKGFQKIVHTCIYQNVHSASVITHGGVIMAVMDEYANPHKDFYEWKVENAKGYAVALDEEMWKKNKEELCLISASIRVRARKEEP